MPSPRSNARPVTPSQGARDMYAALVRGELSGTDALAASQQMLQILMDSMANAVFWKDINSAYLGCNRVFARFAGVEPNVLVGMSDRDMPWADSDDFPADWFTDWDRMVMEEGKPKFGIVERLRSASGQQHWIQTNKVPLRDLDGDVIGVLGTFEDITERRRAEEALQASLNDLDDRVRQRTTELLQANQSLRREVEDRVRLQAQERQQREYAEALRDTAAAMSKSLAVDDVTDEAIAGVQRLVSNDLTGLILATDDDLELARVRVGFGYEATTETMDLSALSVVESLRKTARTIIEDPARALGGARSVMGVRMRVANHLVGYLFVESATSGFFTPSHAERLAAVADQAGAAISNARLAGRVSELAAAEERQRVAKELHDAVNQSLWAAALTAESLLNDTAPGSAEHERASRLAVLTRGALAEMRSLLLEFRPGELESMPLDELIQHLLVALDAKRRLSMDLRLDRVDLDDKTHLAFYRIAQEAIGNVARHAEATSLSVHLTARPRPTLTIADDGKGFDLSAIPPGHLGIGFMRERAQAVGANLSVTTAPEEGTRVEVWCEP